MFQQKVTFIDQIISSSFYMNYISNWTKNREYEDAKFSKLYIDSALSNWFSERIHQLKTIYQLDNSIEIKKNRSDLLFYFFNWKDLINWISESRRIIVINYILYSPDQYCILALLNNMKKSRTFFNNFTNQILQSKILIIFFY